MDATTPCPSCGAPIVEEDGPTSAAFPAPPGCYRLFREVVASQYADADRWAAHGLTVDTYAVQHPGAPGPRPAKALALRLVGLCLRVERGMDPAAVRSSVRRLDEGRRTFPWLPAPRQYGRTVRDVHEAPDATAHLAAVDAWARATWDAWAEHHDDVRSFLVVEQ